MLASGARGREFESRHSDQTTVSRDYCFTVVSRNFFIEKILSGLYMAQKESIDFSRGNMAALILKQAIPLTLAQLASLLYNIVDRIFIGHIEGTGTAALSGLGLTFPIVTIILAFSLLFGMGGTPYFSMLRGAGDEETAKKVMGNAFMLLLGSSVIIMILLYGFMKPIMFLLGASNDSYIFAADYLKIYLLGTIFNMIATGMNYYIPAQGFPKTAMVTTMSGAIINTILDPFFIFNLGMGIRGAAIATVISQFISFLWVMYFILKKAPIILTVDSVRFSPRITKKIISLGFTPFVMEFTNSAASMICNHQLGIYGGDIYISTMTAINSVRSILSLAVTGITSGAQPVLGFNYGAKREDRVKAGIRTTSAMAFIYTSIAWLIVFLFPKFFIGIFTSDQQLLEIGPKYLHIYFMAYIFMALQYSGQSTFMALGKAKPAIFFSLFRKAILVIPLTLLLPLFMKDAAAGVYWAEPVSNIVGGSASFFTMYFTVYRKLDKK